MITQDHLQGHWQRDWIKAPGFEDHTTRVHWLQAGALFADLRIPLERPDVAGYSCLAEFDAPALRAFMGAEGFAGHISLEGSKCTWHRQINWHGMPEQADVGLMAFDNNGGLIEDGVLGEYRELWQAVPRSDLRAAKVTCGAMHGVLIENADLFLLGLGPKPNGTSKNLVEMLDRGKIDVPAMQRHFASAYVLGTWDGPRGIAALSTNPFCEGEVALDRSDTLIWHALGFDGQRSAQKLVIG